MSEIFEILKLDDKELHNLFKEIVSKINYTSPSQLISDFWAEYEKQSGGKSADSSKNRNGQFLELLVQYILCKNDFDLFIEELKKYTFIEAGSVEIVIGNLLKRGK